MEALQPVMSRLVQAGFTTDQVWDLLIAEHPGVWAERVRGFVNTDFHWEWYDLALEGNRVAVVAPREHAKTEVFTVNMTAWRSIYQPGIWTYVFAATLDQAIELRDRIDAAVEEARPDLLDKAVQTSKQQTVYANRSRVTVAGVGKRIRGAHPDIVIGDDVLDEDSTATTHQRDRLQRYWSGTIGGMAHPGARRLVGDEKRWFEPTRIFLVGTPFHEKDLLMGMKSNPIYQYRRYAAEYAPEALVPGTLAVDVS